MGADIRSQLSKPPFLVCDGAAKCCFDGDGSKHEWVANISALNRSWDGDATADPCYMRYKTESSCETDRACTWCASFDGTAAPSMCSLKTNVGKLPPAIFRCGTK